MDIAVRKQMVQCCSLILKLVELGSLILDNVQTDLTVF
jgi:hypothetical protein